MTRRLNLISMAVVALTLSAPAGQALTLADCDRTTHPSHGGENAHRDFGTGWVGFEQWWSQEGTYTDVFIANCASGETLKVRVAEERIGTRLPFDRSFLAGRTIDDHMSGAPAFYHMGTLAQALQHTGEDIAVAVATTEHCACAALYPDLRGTKDPYEEND